MQEVEEKIQTTINQLTETATSIGFRFSPTKTHCIDFCRLRTRHNAPELNMNGIRLEVKSTMKILEVTFDKKLYWKPHIENLTNRCKRALNIIRCISNINWGADREVILLAYKSLILPKLEYGSIVYGSACDTRLNQLEEIQKEGLRLAIEAFRTSPNQSIFCEAGISSLILRRTKLLLNYGVKIWSQSHHPNHPIIYNEAPANKTVGKRIEDDSDTLNIELPHIFPSSLNEIPP
ncbi:hypothetical protein JTB14_016984 [Gonioctena quinquepunctata]|nr:hypothetical protein JTB14_016984 [Gonioctena quinquepunctata]